MKMAGERTRAPDLITPAAAAVAAQVRDRLQSEQRSTLLGTVTPGGASTPSDHG